MMTCREVLDFLMDYLDGTLSPAQRAVFEEHLAVCRSCVAYLHTYQQTVKLGKASAAVTCAPRRKILSRRSWRRGGSTLDSPLLKVSRRRDLYQRAVKLPPRSSKSRSPGLRSFP